MMALLADRDPEVAQAILGENERQRKSIVLIASENYASRRVLEAQATVMTNKYAEGYPGKRYYGGCQYVDVVEQPGHQPGQGPVQRRARQRPGPQRCPG